MAQSTISPIKMLHHIVTNGLGHTAEFSKYIRDNKEQLLAITEGDDLPKLRDNMHVYYGDRSETIKAMYWNIAWGYILDNEELSTRMWELFLLCEQQGHYTN